MSRLSEFRQNIRAWLEDNCPEDVRGTGEIPEGGEKTPLSDAGRRWRTAAAECGYTVPTWPKEYGGAGMSKEEYLVWLDELRRIDAPSPLGGMGVTMIGPTLLEFGTDEQKRRHLPAIARGELRWCQGYSEPGSGSDLASLRTRAEDKGDHFLVNGQKIWTTGAHYADWMFCLVRTNPDAPKHEGISFVLFTMDQPGVEARPIRLISGQSPFCETFLENAIARKEDLVHQLNRGWTVAKRLLQHERSGLNRLAAGSREDGRAEPRLGELAKRYLGDRGGAIADPALRAAVTRHLMNQRAFRLTQRRTLEEAEGTSTPGPATSIFKLYGANLTKERQEIELSMRGFRGLGWEGDAFTADELANTRMWLRTKASSIAGGTDEVQLNIIAKRVLALPD